jgi:hypothetical protein
VFQGAASEHPYAELKQRVRRLTLTEPANNPPKRLVMPGIETVRFAADREAGERPEERWARALAGSAFGQRAEVLDGCVQIPRELQLEPE